MRIDKVNHKSIKKYVSFEITFLAGRYYMWSFNLY